MNRYDVYEARHYSVYANSPQEALEAARSFPHVMVDADAELQRTSLRCDSGKPQPTLEDALSELWSSETSRGR